MAADSIRLQVDKLTANNWATWKYQVSLYLQANGLWEIVQDREVRPATDVEGRAWDVKESKARAAIGLSVDTSLLYLVTSKETAVDTWQALREHFERSNATNVYFLLAQLFELELDEGVDVESHLKRFSELCERLLAVELDVPEPIRVAALLRSLPQSYQVLRTTLQMKGDDLHLQEVMQAIAAEDQQRRGGKMKTNYGGSTAVESAFQAAGRGRGGTGSCRCGAGGGGRGGRAQGHPQQGGPGSSEFQGNCFNCGIQGHMARDCNVPRRERERAGLVDEEERLLYAAEAVVRDDSAALKSSGTTTVDYWVVGSSGDMQQQSYCSGVDTRRRCNDTRIRKTKKWMRGKPVQCNDKLL